jgi:hypothetical protein
MQHRITPPRVRRLSENQIFVFGSNLAGIHGAGAALDAWNWFGAERGVGLGYTGQCYAFPTKDENLKVLSLDLIEFMAKVFFRQANSWPGTEGHIYLITPVGCGLAGYKPEQIAPFFAPAVKNDRFWLPQVFWDILVPGR